MILATAFDRIVWAGCAALWGACLTLAALVLFAGFSLPGSAVYEAGHPEPVDIFNPSATLDPSQISYDN